MRRYLLVIPLLLLIGCRYDTTGIQKTYSADRDNCQGWSENRMGAYERFSAEQGQPMTAQQKNEKLVTFFNECMSEKNWEIGAAPKPAGSTPVPKPVPVQGLKGGNSNISDTTVPAYAYDSGGYEEPPIARDLVAPSTINPPPGGQPVVNGRIPEVTPTMQVPRAMPKQPQAAPEKLPAKPNTPTPPPAKAAAPVTKAPSKIVSQEPPAETIEPSQLMSAPTTPVTVTEATPPAPKAPVMPVRATQTMPPAPKAPAPATSSSPATSTGKLSADQQKRLRKVLGSE